MDIRDVNFDIYGQLLSASGAPMGNNFAISNAIYEQRFAEIAYSPTSNVYLVVWDDNRAENRDIYGQLVSGSSGALIGENFPIAEGANSQMFPELTYIPDGDKFLVTWSEKVGISSNYDVLGRFVSAGYKDPVSGQTFQDVPSNSAFWAYVERLALHKVMGGYTCDNAAGLPCVAPGNLALLQGRG